MGAVSTQSRQFLPFTPLGRATELRAIGVKRVLGLGPGAAVDPLTVLPRVPARLVDAETFVRDAPPHVRQALLVTGPGAWSAIGLGASPVTGEELIVVNSTHHVHRQRASIMEEVVHIVLGHPKTELVRDAGGVVRTRPYNNAVEDEAYSVGAACVLPWPELFTAVSRRADPIPAIAERYSVSADYVRFRILRAGLGRVYTARQRAPA